MDMKCPEQPVAEQAGTGATEENKIKSEALADSESEVKSLEEVETHNKKTKAKGKAKLTEDADASLKGSEEFDEELDESEEEQKTEKPSIRMKKGKKKPRYSTFTRKLWNDEEDEAILSLVKVYGIRRWTLISKKLQENFHIHGRSGKQCRER